MSSSSSSRCSEKKNPKIFKVDLEGNVYCNHDMLAIVRVVSRKSQRIGKEFYGCPLWPRGHCNFFLWKEDFDRLVKDQGKCNMAETGITYEDLKIHNLELQCKILQEENYQLKQKISSKCKWSLGYVLGLVFVMLGVWFMLFV